MATPLSQRIGIWIIAIFMLLGVVGTSLVMVLSMNSQANDKVKYQNALKEYQEKVAAQTKNLSDKYYPEFKNYASIPAIFTTDDIKKLATSDLKVGDGAEIKSNTAYSAYYIGWNPKGVVFDQSIENGALKFPISGGSMISGWEEGVVGMKVGGVRELTIPSEKAYGSTGKGDDIPPNTPIKFIVMVIPQVAEVPIPEALLKYYQQNSQ
jgi:FKBP-type peptidyl-prolyl cis-trans isomerase